MHEPLETIGVAISITAAHPFLTVRTFPITVRAHGDPGPCAPMPETTDKRENHPCWSSPTSIPSDSDCEYSFATLHQSLQLPLWVFAATSKNQLQLAEWLYGSNGGCCPFIVDPIRLWDAKPSWLAQTHNRINLLIARLAIRTFETTIAGRARWIAGCLR